MPESETAWMAIRPGGLICAHGGPSTTVQAVEGNPFRNLEDLCKVKAVFWGGAIMPGPSPDPSGGHA